jgi:hypothetical protein
MPPLPYRTGPSTELAPKSVPLSFWQRVKPTLRFGAPTMIILATYPTLRLIMLGHPIGALLLCAVFLSACLVVLAFWSEPYRTWRQRRVLADSKAQMKRRSVPPHA